MFHHYAVRASKLVLCAAVLLVPACSGTGNGGTMDPPGPAFEEVLTWHNDAAHTGQYLSETILTPASVAPATFGKLFTCPVDGQLYAQPLLKSAVTVPGNGVHNVVYAVTMHDSVYAFDADSNTGANSTPLWQVSFLGAGVTSVPLSDYPGYTDIKNEIGILSTPVIEPSTGTLYLVAKTKETAAVTVANPMGHVYRLHALDLATGAEKFGGPVVLGGSVPGTGDANVGGIITFDPQLQNQRSALCLGGRTIYLAFSSYGDNGPYHGWVLAYDAFTLGQVGIWNDTPNNPTSPEVAGEGGIWMNSSSPAFDGTYVFLTTGNGFFDATGTVTDYSDSAVKLLAGGAGLTVQDYFTPSNQASLSASDYDLDAGGVMLLPIQPGTAPHLLLCAGKNGTVYLINRDAMGHFNAVDQVVQEVAQFPGMTATPAYWNGKVYYKGSTTDISIPNPTPLFAYSLIPGTASTATTVNFAAPSSQSTHTWGWPGSTPSISANGTAGGIVWVIEADFTIPGGSPVSTAAILRAYDATNLATELYDSTQTASDGMGNAVKFTLPTVAHGKVYVGADALSPGAGVVGEVSVFGLK